MTCAPYGCARAHRRRTTALKFPAWANLALELRRSCHDHAPARRDLHIARRGSTPGAGDRSRRVRAQSARLPTSVGLPICDLGTGMWACRASSTLYERQRTGQGRLANAHCSKPRSASARGPARNGWRTMKSRSGRAHATGRTRLISACAPGMLRSTTRKRSGSSTTAPTGWRSSAII